MHNIKSSQEENDSLSNPIEVVAEFVQLLEKSKQLFNGLRELPQYGHRQWHSYFARTFDVYTKLWRFQQQHRLILDTRYGLERWQIGEIASKIGQLYYHYYLRTSETNYLFESFAFYSAIRQRAYYQTAMSRCDLAVKKLRYYARFVVVCLLLKKFRAAHELARELAEQVTLYTQKFGPQDAKEMPARREVALDTDDWAAVIDEIRAFLAAEDVVRVVDLDDLSVTISCRLVSTQVPSLTGILPAPLPPSSSSLQPSSHPPPSGTSPSTSRGALSPATSSKSIPLVLQQAVLVGSSQNQVKFSELTVDMYRMLQCLEREPQDALITQLYRNSKEDSSTAQENSSKAAQISPSPMGAGVSKPSTCPRANTRKYLLYKPTFGQLFAHLSSAHKDLQPNGVLLLYLSSDGSTPFCPPPLSSATAPPHFPQGKRDSGGVWCSDPSTPGVKPTGSTGRTTTMKNLMNVSAEFDDDDSEEDDDMVNNDEVCGIGGAPAGTTEGVESLRRNSGRGSSRNLLHTLGGSLSSPTNQADQANLNKDGHCLYPGDLYPFLRKPLFLIVDSSNSSAFSTLPCLFRQPCVALLSPELSPASLPQTQDFGALFTLFLYSPLRAFCLICGRTSLTVSQWDKCQAIVHKFILEASRILLSDSASSKCFIDMSSDEFLRVLLLRFVFCCVTLRFHTAFRGPTFYPQSVPPLSSSILGHSALRQSLFDLAQELNVSQYFSIEKHVTLLPNHHGQQSSSQQQHHHHHHHHSTKQHQPKPSCKFPFKGETAVDDDDDAYDEEEDDDLDDPAVGFHDDCHDDCDCAIDGRRNQEGGHGGVHYVNSPSNLP